MEYYYLEILLLYMPSVLDKKTIIKNNTHSLIALSLFIQATNQGSHFKTLEIICSN